MNEEKENTELELHLMRRIEYIKYGVLHKLFSASQDWQLEYEKYMDKDFSLPADKEPIMDAKAEVIVDNFKNIVDVVWKDGFEDEDEKNLGNHEDKISLN